MIGVFAVAISWKLFADGFEKVFLSLFVNFKGFIVYVWEKINFVKPLGNDRRVLLEIFVYRSFRTK